MSLAWDRAELVMPVDGALAATAHNVSIAMISKGDHTLVSFSFKILRGTLPQIEEIVEATAAAIAVVLEEHHGLAWEPEDAE